MNKVTGLKRKNEYLVSDEIDVEQVQPPAAKHPTPSLNTSRCTVQAIPGHLPFLPDPPTFPGEPINPNFGIWGWLPPSMAEKLWEQECFPLFMQAPQEVPDPRPPTPLDIPLSVIAQPAPPTCPETDAQLLEQLEAVCKEQVASTNYASTAVKILLQREPLHERVSLLVQKVNTDRRLAQSLLTLVRNCQRGTRLRDFVMSLFLVMTRMPDSRHREEFIKNLPPKLSPELQDFAIDVANYWRDATTSRQCTAQTQDLARQVCQHFGW